MSIKEAIEEKYGKVKGIRETVMENEGLILISVYSHDRIKDNDVTRTKKTASSIKVKELIKQLQEIEKEHGNLEVFYIKDTWHSRGKISSANYYQERERILLDFDLDEVIK